MRDEVKIKVINDQLDGVLTLASVDPNEKILFLQNRQGKITSYIKIGDLVVINRSASDNSIAVYHNGKFRLTVPLDTVITIISE